MSQTRGAFTDKGLMETLAMLSERSHLSQELSEITCSWQQLQTVISDEHLQEENLCLHKKLIMNREFREFMAGKENMLGSGGSLYQ